tara:strand:+ start:22 stop:405 length:384 start_codon:yes stop_codon:yes gene_type:complete
MEACAKLLGVFGAPFCAERSSVCVGKNPFRHAATITLVAGGIVVACVLAAVAFATGFEFRSFGVSPFVVAVVAASLVAAVALVHYVPAKSSASWCREVELCDCLVRNSKMEPPQAAAVALAARNSQR